MLSRYFDNHQQRKQQQKTKAQMDNESSMTWVELLDSFNDSQIQQQEQVRECDLLKMLSCFHE
jgi:hypothetical protein